MASLAYCRNGLASFMTFSCLGDALLASRQSGSVCQRGRLSVQKCSLGRSRRRLDASRPSTVDRDSHTLSRSPRAWILWSSVSLRLSISLQAF